MAQAGLARGGALTYSRLLQLIVAYCGLLRYPGGGPVEGLQVRGGGAGVKVGRLHPQPPQHLIYCGAIRRNKLQYAAYGGSK